MYIVVKTLLQHVSVHMYHHQAVQMQKLNPMAGNIPLQYLMTDVYYNHKIKLQIIKNVGIH